MREVAYRSLDFRDVEPILGNPSGGSDPNAFVVWSELQDGLNLKLSPAQLENALANLFEEILLTDGVTEQRDGSDGTPYFYTRFTATVSGWQTDKLSEIALIERATGIQRNYAHLFRATGPGTFFVEFESKRTNPVLPDDAFLLRVQRLPEIGVVDVPDWLAGDAARIGNIFYQVYTGVDGAGVATFRNGNTTTGDVWPTLSYPDKEALIGVRPNADGNLEVV